MKEVTSLHAFSRPPHILLRSSWQAVNIGDIGHTPGILSLLRRHIPEAKVTLWPCSLELGSRGLLQKFFPEVEVVEGKVEEGSFTSPEIGAAFENADFLLHSSGPHLVGERDLVSWRKLTGKPYGVYGITLDPITTDPCDPDVPTEGDSLKKQWEEVVALPATKLAASTRDLLNNSDFIFCRETMTQEYLKRQDVDVNKLGFAPDAAFGIEMRNDELAKNFLHDHGLEEGRYLCAIPRLRYTPYHEIHRRPATRRDTLRQQLSERHRERDMKKFREIIIEWVRKTGLKVLLCPEMTYQIDVAKKSVYDLLPEDVKSQVVCRMNYWLPDEACSTYALSHTLLSMDNHSPIFALAMGVPTVFMRHPTDTIKGQMWPDIGMGDWFVETDMVEASDVIRVLMGIQSNREAALDRVQDIMGRVRNLQGLTMRVLAERLAIIFKKEPATIA